MVKCLRVGQNEFVLGIKTENLGGEDDLIILINLSGTPNLTLQPCVTVPCHVWP